MLRIRKIYVLNPHIFGLPVGHFVEKPIAKSDCLTLEPNPLRADAILALVPYQSWLDKIGQGLAGSCVSTNTTLLCQDPNGGTDTLQCDAGGCISGASGPQQSRHWVLLSPKTGRPISDWSSKRPPIHSLEAAVGCKK